MKWGDGRPKVAVAQRSGVGLYQLAKIDVKATTLRTSTYDARDVSLGVNQCALIETLGVGGVTV
jgi:hypothetical protein